MIEKGYTHDQQGEKTHLAESGGILLQASCVLLEGPPAAHSLLLQ